MPVLETKPPLELAYDRATAIHAQGVERLKDIALGFQRGPESLIELGYPDLDQPRVRQLTAGLKLDHMGMLLPCPWSDVEPFMAAVIGEVASVQSAKSVILKNRLTERTGVEFPVEIHFVTFKNPNFPALELFSVEGDPYQHGAVKLQEFAAARDLHLAFRVGSVHAAEVENRLRTLDIPEVSQGTHLFTGEKCRYYDLGGDWRRNIELLWPS